MSRRRSTTDSPAPRFCFFGGKGGAGKTTCAAAFALARAERGRRVLVLSADPAHSLGDALALRLGADPRRVRGARGWLDAAEIDSTQALRHWLRSRRALLRTILLRGTFFDESDVAQLLRLAIPGVDEVMGLLELERLAGIAPYDEVVVDMAPTGHALRLLRMPDAQRRLARVLDGMQEKHRILGEHLGRRHAADRADALVAELDEAAGRLEDLLRDRFRTAFCWVTLAEPLAVAETGDALAALGHEGFPLSGIIANRVTVGTGDCADCRRRGDVERTSLEALRAAHRGIALRRLPELDAEPRGVPALRAAGRRLIASSSVAGERPVRRGAVCPGRAGGPDDRRRAPGRRTPLSGRLGLPAGVQLVIVAGKGGVGKTTCAAAMALALASAAPRRRVLLLSVDPAHSLSDVLGLSIGDRRRTIGGAGRLDARELDAGRAFGARRERYAQGLEALLGGGGGDSALAGQLMALAPPGLDEIFAILAVIDALGAGAPAARRSCDLLVLDTAPTGHTLRLFETVGLAQAWVRSALGMLVKYRTVLEARDLGAELLELSRGLRSLGQLVRNRRRTAGVVVTRPGRVVRAETGRLLAGLDRLGVPVSTVLVNAVSAPECAWCRRRALAQGHELKELRRLGAVRRSRMVAAPARTPPPRGLAALAAWSRCWVALES